jgi:hypothetical protein
MAKAAAKNRPEDRIAQLEDDLKQRDARIKELRADLDKAEALVVEEREHVEDAEALIDSWIEAFGMVQDENGKWSYAEWIDNCVEYRDCYIELRDEWNKHVAAFNATIAPRTVGRPLAASEAQVATVLKLRKRGVSLRGLAEETSLGLPTVRTIVDKRDGRDRTTIKHLARIDPDRKLEASWRARKRVRDALPKRIAATLEQGRELVKQAKGLK